MKPTPMERLAFYRVAHKLRHRLEPYQITELPRPFRSSTWNDLVYWQMLLDGDDAGIARLAGADSDAPIPTPEEWFGRSATATALRMGPGKVEA